MFQCILLKKASCRYYTAGFHDYTKVYKKNKKKNKKQISWRFHEHDKMHYTSYYHDPKYSDRQTGPSKQLGSRSDAAKAASDQLCWGLTTRQPLCVILCRLPEKGRKEIEETVEEMKERNREERGTGMKGKKQKK